MLRTVTGNQPITGAAGFLAGLLEITTPDIQEVTMDARQDGSSPQDPTRVTQMLEEDHVVIESVLSALSVMIRRSRDTGALDLDDARETIRFLTEFADTAHHEKEELHLFPAMERAGLPPQGGPTSVMREEHDAGRAHVRAMTAALDASPPDIDAFQTRASSFVLLLRDHIAKENQVLFQMADQLLSPEAQQEINAAFAAADPAIRTHFAAVAARLSSTYAE